MRELFIEHNFRADALSIIEQANAIIRDYQARGFTLTLRQLYYQFVARALIPNKQREYDRIGSILNKARLAGLVDWDAIEDRTRNVRKPSVWADPPAILSAVASQYKEDLWHEQPYRIEVWIEKDALIGVVEPVCERWRIPYFACRGYTSQSEQYTAGKRLRKVYSNSGGMQRPVVFHLGDHDPSGMDMTRDNDERLAMFAGAHIEVKRLALNMDQIRFYNPPPNPAKFTDSRAASYISKFGISSWELDALDPSVIDALIEDAIKDRLDQHTWDQALQQEEDNKAKLENLSINWTDISRGL